MKGINFIPYGTALPFLSWRNIAFLGSGLGIVVSILMFFTTGLNFGIDFRGGAMFHISTENKQPADIAAIRKQIGALNLGDVQIQEFGKPTDVLIRVELQGKTDEDQQKVVTAVKGALGDKYQYLRVEVVGPTVSHELVWSGIFAVIGAILAVLVYIWFRFEWQFAVGAVVALIHDVALTVGLLTFLQLEFSLSIIAAILTIVGYSLNDTVVVYDRVRENLRKYKKMPLEELLDRSINETLSRTVITSVTTLLALFSLYIFGGEVIRGFTFTMIWGIVVGTYSSIFIAAPLLLLLNVTRDWSGVGTSRYKQA